MTVILTADAGARLAAAPTPIEWDGSFARIGPNTWDVTVHLAAERDPYTMAPDPLFATATVRAEATGDAHRFNIRGPETVAWFGGDENLLAVAHQIIGEVTR